MRHEPEDGEHHEAGEEGGGAVEDGHEEGVAEAVVAELVEGAQGGQGAPSCADREEDLNRRVRPNLGDFREVVYKGELPVLER